VAVNTCHRRSPNWKQRPEKEKNRLRIYANAKRHKRRCFRYAFELPGTKYEYTKYLERLMQGETKEERLSRILGAESVYKEEAERNNPGIMLCTTDAYKALNYFLYGLQRTYFDFMWLDFVGCYGKDKEKLLDLIFTVNGPLIRRDSLLYFTFNRNSRGCDKKMLDRVLKTRISLDSKLVCNAKDELVLSIPYYILFKAYHNSYSLVPIFQDFYKDNNKHVMYVFGFKVVDAYECSYSFLQEQVNILDTINNSKGKILY